MAARTTRKQTNGEGNPIERQCAEPWNNLPETRLSDSYISEEVRQRSGCRSQVSLGASPQEIAARAFHRVRKKSMGPSLSYDHFDSISIVEGDTSFDWMDQRSAPPIVGDLDVRLCGWSCQLAHNRRNTNCMPIRVGRCVQNSLIRCGSFLVRCLPRQSHFRQAQHDRFGSALLP
jgi:hypothetical protein